MENKNPLLSHQFPVEYYGTKYKERLVDELTGRGNVYALIRTLHNQTNDFPDIYKQYLASIEKLAEILGPESSRDIKKLMVAIDIQCSALLFAVGIDGLKMNYQHFVNPMAPNCTWPNIDHDDYLRISLASCSPRYKATERFIEEFRKRIPKDHESVWDAILSYRVALELDGSKLAHYYGYLAGNELLGHYIPGYEPDYPLTYKYTHQLESWYQRPLRTDEWDGIIRLTDWVIAPIELSDPQDDFTLIAEILRPGD